MKGRILANDLKVARARKDMTQAKLAEEVGVTRKTINSIENTHYLPSTLLALLIADALDTTVDELFWVTEEENRG